MACNSPKALYESLLYSATTSWRCGSLARRGAAPVESLEVRGGGDSDGGEGGLGSGVDAATAGEAKADVGGGKVGGASAAETRPASVAADSALAGAGAGDGWLAG